jgi:molybdopterin-containing oxidoreductase family iron-sulfur binding subunit
MRITRRVFLGAAGLAAAGAPLAGRVIRLEDEAAQAQAAGGRRFAMLIDVGKCLKAEGCTKCTEACHAAHNVPAPGGAGRDIKWLWKERFDHAFPEQVGGYANDRLAREQVPILCNHCDNPPCARVCPTQATWKREDGIVMMDWHRCVGCRYCAAACPYGSRSFNFDDPRPRIRHATAEFPTRTKGVVEKCTFCEERLAAGRPPACVEICPEQAMVFGDLADPASALRQQLAGRFAIRRKVELGTGPAVYYLV